MDDTEFTLIVQVHHDTGKLYHILPEEDCILFFTGPAASAFDVGSKFYLDPKVEYQKSTLSKEKYLKILNEWKIVSQKSMAEIISMKTNSLFGTTFSLQVIEDEIELTLEWNQTNSKEAYVNNLIKEITG